MIHKVLRLVKSRDLNSQNTLFGGQLLKWVDEEVGTFATWHLEIDGGAIVNMKNANFLAPSRQKDLLEISIEVLSYGRTSMKLQVVVHNITQKKDVFTMDEVVMVAVDENYKPTPHGKIFQKKDPKQS